MASLKFVTVDVFTKDRYAGNPLAIVTYDADSSSPTTEQMQTITREFNLSETVFLQSKSDKRADGTPEFNARIFTLESELPFAGHPTIGTATYIFEELLQRRVQRCVLNVPAGPIELEYDGGASSASIPHNVHIHSANAFTAEQARVYQPTLGAQAILSVETVSPVRGMAFGYVQLRELQDLAAVKVVGTKPKFYLDDHWGGFSATSWYVIEGDAEANIAANLPVHIRVRMLEAMFEDPATGSAACALSSLLALRYRKARRVSFAITQGVEMGRRSDIGIAVTLNEALDAVEAIDMKGTAVRVMRGEVEF